MSTDLLPLSEVISSQRSTLEIGKTCADFLALYFRTSDSVYKDLFIAEQIGKTDLARPVLSGLDPASTKAMESVLEDARHALATPIKKSLNVLFFADCLSRDIRSCITAECLREGISIEQSLIYNKDPAAQRNALRALADKKLDVIFYSPFTYAFSPAYTQLLAWKSALLSRRTIRRRVEDVMTEVTSVMDLMSDLFACNIFIHNSANFRRHGSKQSDRAVNLLTHRTRSIARYLANEKLAEYIAKRNAATFEHLHSIDEMALLKHHGEWELGRRLYDSENDQPVGAIGKWLAPEYQDIVSVLANLFTRKVIVCDLDNTLWDGVIGEGAVKHYVDRQQILQRLRKKGVLLAINSKNDPRNIKWEASVLNADDFVCSQVNWNPKVSNIRGIRDALNLKTKDFIFIDDRADERAMVGEAYPEIHCLDATSDRAWQLLALWAKLLPDQDETDRTEFYRQRESRQKYLESIKVPEEDEGKLFAKLGLRITIRPAKKGDLKRVAELINRTNQFNLCGSRTSLKEVTQWAEDRRRNLIIVDAADKFGSMGTVCVAVFNRTEVALEIPVFVLSCRVFGYQIENAVINLAKKIAGEKDLPIEGLYVETAHNEPCRRVYPDNGFTWQSSAWHYQGAANGISPDWLAIDAREI